MKIVKTVGRIAAILAAALLVTWGLYSFVNSDFAASLPANRRELEFDGDEGRQSAFNERNEREEHQNGLFGRPDADVRPGRGEGGHHAGNAVNLGAFGELIEPLVKVAFIVAAFVLGARLFGRRKAQQPAPPTPPSAPPIDA